MGKLVVITGASGVLCSAFARTLAADGMKLALLGRNFEATIELADEICKAGGIAKAYKVDVLDKESLETAHQQIISDMGLCDVLINGAGGNHPSGTTKNEYHETGDELKTDFTTFFNLASSDFSYVFDLNLLGTLLPSQVFCSDMLGRDGCSIINMSSMSAFTPLTKTPAYSAAKAAVSNLTQWMAVHFAKQGIRVNALAPGFFATKQNQSLLYNEDGTPTTRSEKILQSTPMNRFGTPHELTGPLRWLIGSEMSGFVTGVVIPVDGGFSAYSGV